MAATKFLAIQWDAIFYARCEFIHNVFGLPYKIDCCREAFEISTEWKRLCLWGCFILLYNDIINTFLYLLRLLESLDDDSDWQLMTIDLKQWCEIYFTTKVGTFTAGADTAGTLTLLLRPVLILELWLFLFLMIQEPWSLTVICFGVDVVFLITWTILYSFINLNVWIESLRLKSVRLKVDQ